MFLQAISLTCLCCIFKALNSMGCVVLYYTIYSPICEKGSSSLKGISVVFPPNQSPRWWVRDKNVAINNIPSHHHSTTISHAIPQAAISSKEGGGSFCRYLQNFPFKESRGAFLISRGENNKIISNLMLSLQVNKKRRQKQQMSH